MRGRSIAHTLALIRHLVRRDFILNYRRSTLGVLWSLLLPLAQLGVMVVVFGTLVPLGIPRYPAFVFSALLPWTWFSSTVSAACMLFLSNRDLVRRPGFSPALLMVVAMLSSLITYLAGVPILLAVMLWHGDGLSPVLVFFPLLTVIEGVLIVGVGLLVATLNVFYRDVQYITVVAVMLLFYLTPVFYRLPEDVPGVALLYVLNPMAGLIEGYRAVFFYGVSPSPGHLVQACISTALVALIGYAAYRRAEQHLVDLV